MKPKPVRGNKTNKRRIEFYNGSLERKAKYHEEQQSRFDEQTERLIRKYSKKKPDMPDVQDD